MKTTKLEYGKSNVETLIRLGYFIKKRVENEEMKVLIYEDYPQ